MGNSCCHSSQSTTPSIGGVASYPLRHCANKAIARSYVWWPHLDQDLEKLAKSCIQCQSYRNMPVAAPLHPWLWPSKPWQRIHIDYAGPINGKMMLVVIDAHSKWPEVISMSSSTTQATIEGLRRLFAAYGLPQQLVSDNGPPFTAAEFDVFLRKNGVKHIYSSPYHPSTNGLADLCGLSKQP